MEVSSPNTSFQNIKVICRLRPKIDKIRDGNQYQYQKESRLHDSSDDCIVVLDDQQLKILPKDSFDNTSSRTSKEKLFKFNRIFHVEATQEFIYAEIADIVYSAVQGYNSTIFAYGAFGTGKTYTIVGNEANPGIIPRAIEDIFHIIDNTKSQGVEALFHVEISYIELYNNLFRNLFKQITDELSVMESNNDSVTSFLPNESTYDDHRFKLNTDLSHGLDKVTIHESTTAGVFLSGPNLRLTVKNASDALNFIDIGNKLRNLHSLSTHDASSRSHSMLTVFIESKVAFQKDNVVRSELRLGKLHLIDLAGSERLAESKAEGDVAKETQSINKSLLALGEVLHALSLNASISMKTKRNSNHNLAFGSTNSIHIPYYNSKLTHLLKDSLGGNSKTVMIANIGSEIDHYHHTLYTLMYASRATKVRNTPHINRISISDTDFITTGYKNEKDVFSQLKLKLLQPKIINSLKSPIVQKYIDATTKSKTSSSPKDQNQDSSLAKFDTTLSATFVSPKPQLISNSINVLTLKLKTIQAQKLQYVAFPLCPILKIRVAHQEAITSKKLYVHSIAVFNEVFELEILPEEYEKGLIMEVEAVNISASTGLPLSIGEGYFEITKSALGINKQKHLTINLFDSNSSSSGYVKISATMLDRPGKMNLFSPPPAMDLQSFDVPLTPAMNNVRHQLSKNIIKSGLLSIQRILCFDLILDSFLSKNFGIFNGQYVATVQIGKETISTAAVAGIRIGRGSNSTVSVSFDKLKLIYQVNFNELDHTYINLILFDASMHPIGHANAPLFSLKDRNDSIYSLGSEFAMLLKDENKNVMGKASLFLHVSVTNEDVMNKYSERSPNNNSSLISSSSFVETSMTPKIYNFEIPEGVKSGWIHFRSISATNLNKFRLLGNSVKFQDVRNNLFDSPIPSYLKHSELHGKQDPIVMLEIEDFWCSHSEVLLNEGFNCSWNDMNTSCYLSNLTELRESTLKILVFDCSCEGYSNVFLGSAFVPLINLIGLSVERNASEASIEVSIVDRKGKFNGRLHLNYAFVASEEHEEWKNGTIKSVCGNGCYDVIYDNNKEEEFQVSKDRIFIKAISSKLNQLSRSSSNRPPIGKYQSGSESKSLCYTIGSKVEINDQERGLWFPAIITRKNPDGSYEVDSDYDILKYSISSSLIRQVAIPSSVSPLVKSLHLSRSASPETVTRKYSPQRLIFDDEFVLEEKSQELNRKERHLLASPIHKFKSDIPDHSAVKFNVNDNVEINYRGHGLFVNATIEYIHPNGLYNVKYISGDIDFEVNEDLIRAISQANHHNILSVGMNVEVNSEGLGIWHHARIKALSIDNKYDVQYDDGSIQYGMEEIFLRVSSSLVSGMHSRKPFFIIGDKVKVCKTDSFNNIPELSSLSIIKNLIKENRTKLEKDDIVIQEYIQKVKFGIAKVEEKLNNLEAFKKRIAYINPDTIHRDDDPIPVNRSEIIAVSSLQLLNQIVITIINDHCNAIGDSSSENTLLPMELMEHIVCKAIILDESAGYIDRIVINDLLNKSNNHKMLTMIELNKANDLSVSIKSDEVELRKLLTGLNFDLLLSQACNKAENENVHLEIAIDMNAKNINILKELLLFAESASKKFENACKSGDDVYDLYCRRDASLCNNYRNWSNENNSNNNIFASFEVGNDTIFQLTLHDSFKLHLEHRNLRNALIHLKQASDEFLKLKVNVENSTEDFLEVRDELEYLQNEIKCLKESNQTIERDLLHEDKLSAAYIEYVKIIASLELYEEKLNLKRNSYLADLSLIENTRNNRANKETIIFSLSTKRVIAESKIRKAILNGDFLSTRIAILDAADIAEEQISELIVAKLFCETEIEKYHNIKELAEEEVSLSVLIKNTVYSASKFLSSISFEIKDRDYQVLENIQSSSTYLNEQYMSIVQMLSLHKSSYYLLYNSILIESQCLSNMKKASHPNHNQEEGEVSNYSKERMIIENNIRQLSSQRKLEDAKFEKSCKLFTDKQNELIVFKTLGEEDEGTITYSPSERSILKSAIALAQTHYDILVTAKELAIDELNHLETGRKTCETELKLLTNSYSIERDQMKQILVSKKSIAECSRNLSLSKAQIAIKDEKIFEDKKMIASKAEEFRKIKLKYLQIYDVVRNKIITKPKKELSDGSILNDSSDDPIKLILDAIEVSETLLNNASSGSSNAEAIAKVAAVARDREELAAKTAILKAANPINSNITNAFENNDDTDICIAFFVATIHSDAQIAALDEVVSFLEMQFANLNVCISQAEEALAQITAFIINDLEYSLMKFTKCSKEHDFSFPASIRLITNSESSYNDIKNALDDEISKFSTILQELKSNAVNLSLRKDYRLELWAEYCNFIRMLVIEEIKINEFHKKTESERIKSIVASQEREIGNETIAQQRKNIDLLRIRINGNANEDILNIWNEMNNLLVNADTAYNSIEEYYDVEYHANSKASSYTQMEFNAIILAKEYANKANAILLDKRNFIQIKPVQLDSPNRMKLLYLKQKLTNITKDFHVLIENKEHIEEAYHLINRDAIKQQSLLEESMISNIALSNNILDEKVFLPDQVILMDDLENIRMVITSECDKVNYSLNMKETEMKNIEYCSHQVYDLQLLVTDHEQLTLAADKIFEIAVLENNFDDAENATADSSKYIELQIELINKAVNSAKEELKSWENVNAHARIINDVSVTCQAILKKENRLLLKIQLNIAISKAKLLFQKSNSDAEANSKLCLESLAELTRILAETKIESHEIMELLHQLRIYEEKAIQFKTTKDLELKQAETLYQQFGDNLKDITSEAKDLRLFVELSLLNKDNNNHSATSILPQTSLDDTQITCLDENIQLVVSKWNSARVNTVEEIKYYKIILDFAKRIKRVIEHEYDIELDRITQHYQSLKDEILLKDNDLTELSQMNSTYTDFTVIMRDLEECDESLISAFRQAKLSTLSKADAIAIQKYKIIEESNRNSSDEYSLALKQSSEGYHPFSEFRDSVIKIALELEKDEMIAMDESRKISIEELRCINLAIEKASVALGILNNLKDEQNKEESEKIAKLISELNQLKNTSGSTLSDTDIQFEKFQELKSTISIKVEELFDESKFNPTNLVIDTRETLLIRINLYQQIQKLQNELEIEDEPLIISVRQKKIAAVEKAKYFESNRSKISFNMLLEEKESWIEANYLAQYEFTELLNTIEKAREIINLLNKMKDDQLQREKLALLRYISDAEQFRAEYDGLVNTVKSRNRVLDEVKVQIFILDQDLPLECKKASLYKDFRNLYDEINEESSLVGLRQSRLSIAANAEISSSTRRREEKLMFNANKQVAQFKNAVNLYSLSAGELNESSLEPSRLELEKWVKIELQALTATSSFAIEERNAWNDSIIPIKSELNELETFICKANDAIDLLQQLKFEYDLEGLKKPNIDNNTFEDFKNEVIRSKIDLENFNNKILLVQEEIMVLNKENEELVVLLNEKGDDFINEVKAFKESKQIFRNDYDMIESNKVLKDLEYDIMEKDSNKFLLIESLIITKKNIDLEEFENEINDAIHSRDRKTQLITMLNRNNCIKELNELYSNANYFYWQFRDHYDKVTDLMKIEFECYQKLHKVSQEIHQNLENAIKIQNEKNDRSLDLKEINSDEWINKLLTEGRKLGSYHRIATEYMPSLNEGRIYRKVVRQENSTVTT